MNDRFWDSGGATAAPAASALGERRKAKRYPFSVVAEIAEAATSTALPVRVADISRQGCYVDCLNPLPTGTAVQISIRRRELEFTSAARVVYSVTGLGMGLKFTELTEEKAAMIEKWLDEGSEGTPGREAVAGATSVERRALERLVELMTHKGQLSAVERDELFEELRRK